MKEYACWTKSTVYIVSGIYYIFIAIKKKALQWVYLKIKNCERVGSNPILHFCLMMKNLPNIIIFFILKDFANMGGLFKWEYKLDLNFWITSKEIKLKD